MARSPPSSAFLTIYLTAIVFPQAADLSLSTKTTQDLTMPGSNSSELTTSSHNEKSDALKSETNQDCPNCNDDTKVNKKLLATELRIQMIKEKILAKLQLDREPVLAQNLTELKFSTVLSNLNLIEDKNEPIHNGEEYYAKTTQIIVFSEEGKRKSLVDGKISLSEFSPQSPYINVSIIFAVF